MARLRPSGRETKWMVAGYAVPGAVFLLALVVLALVGYPLATRLLAVAAAMLGGLVAWCLASRSSRRPLFVGLVAAAHLAVVVGFPALALTAYPGWMNAGEYEGLTFRTVPAAVWNGVSLSFVPGLWSAVMGPFRGRASVDRDRLF